jgi:hypothetical protein
MADGVKIKYKGLTKSAMELRSPLSGCRVTPETAIFAARLLDFDQGAGAEAGPVSYMPAVER